MQQLLVVLCHGHVLVAQHAIACAAACTAYTTVVINNSNAVNTLACVSETLMPFVAMLLCWQVKSELAVVDKTNAQVQSFARVNFVEPCEAAINEQIK